MDNVATQLLTASQFSLRVVMGPASGRVIPILSGGLLLGREPGPGSISDDPAISRRHVRLSVVPDEGLRVEDLGSTNGTFVNDGRVTVPVVLRAGDRLRLGSTVFQLSSTRTPLDGATNLGAGVDLVRAGTGGTNETGEKLLQQANELIAAGRDTESEVVLRRLLSSPDQEVHALYELGSLRLRLNDLNQAERYFASAISIDPRHENAMYQLGVIAERLRELAEARRRYARVLELNPRHVSARARLQAMERGVPQPPALAASPMSPPSAVEESDQRFGIYDFLRSDPSPVSQQAIGLMDELETSVRPNIAAYVGRNVGRFVLRYGLLSAILLWLFTHMGSESLERAFGHRVNVTATVLGGVAVLAVLRMLMGLVSILTTRITLQKGRLQIAKGLLSRRLVNVDLWRVRNIELYQTFLNRLTGDGTLILYVNPEPDVVRKGRKRRREKTQVVVFVIGIARGSRLRRMYQQLLNLSFLLRGHQVVKGIIQ